MGRPLQAGTIVRGKYRVERVLGEGGMGLVVAAWHLRLQQRVAIKILKPDMLQHAEIIERFLREARAASRIESDHVARVMDVDTLDDGAPFLVMEYLEGSDLSGVRKAQLPLPIRDAVDHVLQACEAVAEAHALGIVHRDLKPPNLFLTRRRDGRTRVKVLDFGISKVTGTPGDSEAGMTGAAAVMGTVEYMSPEQMISSRDVDGRTDIWALGVILYELCTAQVPFPGTTLTQVCALVMTTKPPPPSAARPDMPPGLELVILRCLEKDREMRFGSVAQLMEALAPYGSAGESAEAAAKTLVLPQKATATLVSDAPEPATLVRQAPAIEATTGGPGTIGAVSSGPVGPPPLRTTWPYALGAVVVLAAVAGSAVSVMRGGAGAAGVPSTSSAPQAPPASSVPSPASAPSASSAPEVPPTSADPVGSAAPVPMASDAPPSRAVTPKPARSVPRATAVATAPPPPPAETQKPPAKRPDKSID